jgi:type I restriction enzyme M protein
MTLTTNVRHRTPDAKEDRNAETMRTQSSYSKHIFRALVFQDEIAEHGYVLTPGRYVGAEEVEDDGVPFAEKMVTLTTELADQFAQSASPEKAIRKNMKALGFELPIGGEK